MPAGQPFTRLCQLSAQLRAESNRVDLHLHTCHSDGAWAPAEVVERARRRGLGAIAITDHDICSGIEEAQIEASLRRPAIEVVPGVEVTCEHRGRELHLLGYFFRLDDPDLTAALATMRERRRDRFREMVARLPAAGATIDAEAVEARMATGRALGRFDVAALLVQAGKARTVFEAISRFLRDGGPIVVAKQGLPVARAIELLKRAGGACSWAHPAPDATLEAVIELRDMGLDALEAEHPTFTKSASRRMRELAQAAGLAISGGSDCHGPAPATRAIGTKAISRTELEQLRSLRHAPEVLEPNGGAERGANER